MVVRQERDVLGVGAQSEWRAGRCPQAPPAPLGRGAFRAVLAAVPIVALGAGTATPAGATPLPVLSVSPTNLSFPETTLGDFTVLSFTVTNPDHDDDGRDLGLCAVRGGPQRLRSGSRSQLHHRLLRQHRPGPRRVVFHHHRVQPRRTGDTLRHVDAHRHVQLQRSGHRLGRRRDRLLPGRQRRHRCLRR